MTTNTAEALEGSVLPFGGPKGYGIALMVEIMAAILSGASSGPAVGDLYTNLESKQDVGAFFNIIDLAAFTDEGQFASRMLGLVNGLKETAAEGSEVFMPGEIEDRLEQERRKHGIELPETVVEEIDRLPGDIPLRDVVKGSAHE